MYPQLTSRIRGDCFLPMECPTFPLDTEFHTKDMLHTKFDVENGPLWKVQLITEATMEKAAAGLGRDRYKRGPKNPSEIKEVKLHDENINRT